MSIVDRYLLQDAIWWQYEDSDLFGNPSFSDPVQIKCRWTDKNEQYLDRSGNTAVSRAFVLVDREMREKDVLKLGTISSALNNENPKNNEDAYEIKSFYRVPWLDASFFLYKAYL